MILDKLRMKCRAPRQFCPQNKNYCWLRLSILVYSVLCRNLLPINVTYFSPSNDGPNAYFVLSKETLSAKNPND